MDSWENEVHLLHALSSLGLLRLPELGLMEWIVPVINSPFSSGQLLAAFKGSMIWSLLKNLL